MSTHERDSQLSAYLLDELGAEERTAFEHELAQDTELRAEVERLRPVVSQLDALPAEGWEGAVEPPPLRLPSGALAFGRSPADGSRDTIALADGMPAASPHPRRERRRRLLGGPLIVRPAFAALSAAALLALGIGLGMLIDGGATSRAPSASSRTVALQPLQSGAAAHGHALVADTAGGQQRVTLRLRGLPRSRAHQFYEVWLMDAKGPLIAIGSFRVGADGRATLELPLPVAATRYQYFDISVQPEGNDAGHSGDSVLRGATA
jgi:anti-sigma-K factor RskA